MKQLPKDDTQSFIDQIKKGDIFYYVNVEIFKDGVNSRKEMSHVDFIEIEAIEVTSRSIHCKDNIIIGQSPIFKKKMLKSKLRTQDYENDFAGWYKRNYLQSIYFLNKYIEAFKENENIQDDIKEFYVNMLDEAIQVIEWKIIIWN